MFNILSIIPKIPLAEWMQILVDWLRDEFAFVFEPIKKHFGNFMEFVSEDVLMSIPPIVFIIFVAALATFLSARRKFGIGTILTPIFTIFGLWFIYNQGYWEELMFTVTLVILSSLLSIIIGVPIGILMSKSKIASLIITPILDFMQTMPAFVYLIPAVAFFGIGMVPGVFASLIFATPPTVRLTNLGIRQVSNELVEAADAFGSTGWQKLFKVELPMAKSTIMAGITQTVMLSLSMVVIASMIGAPGLGREVLTALQRSQVGIGFVSGLSIVILAIIIDRMTQNISKNAKTK